MNNGERGGGVNPAAVTGYPFWQSGVDRDVIIETAVVIFHTWNSISIVSVARNDLHDKVVGSLCPARAIAG